MAFGFLIFDGVEELDFVGPWEFITAWSRFLGGPAPCITIAATMAPVRCANGLVVQPDADYATAPALRYLLVPGGIGTRREADNAVTLDYLRHVGPRCEALLSVCTGAFLLHAAGLAQGVPLTTHWGSLQRLRDNGHAPVVEQRWVRSERVWSSAGVSAGMDMTLAFIADVAGEQTAAKVQFGAEYYADGRVYGDPARLPQAPQYLKERT